MGAKLEELERTLAEQQETVLASSAGAVRRYREVTGELKEMNQQMRELKGMNQQMRELKDMVMASVVSPGPPQMLMDGTSGGSGWSIASRRREELTRRLALMDASSPTARGVEAELAALEKAGNVDESIDSGLSISAFTDP